MELDIHVQCTVSAVLYMYCGSNRQRVKRVYEEVEYSWHTLDSRKSRCTRCLSDQVTATCTCVGFRKAERLRVTAIRRLPRAWESCTVVVTFSLRTVPGNKLHVAMGRCTELLCRCKSFSRCVCRGQKVLPCIPVDL